MQTSNHLFVDTCTEVGVLGNGQTTIVVVGNYRNIFVCPLVCLCDGVDLITILKSVPLGLVSTDRPIETWVETTAGSTLSLEEVVEPR